MVDLVKIRKKAKADRERKDDAAPTTPETKSVEVAPKGEEPKKRAGRKRKAPGKKKERAAKKKPAATAPASEPRPEANDARKRLEKFRETAGEPVRFETAAEDGPPEQDEDVRELLTFEIGSEMFSIDVTAVEEILVPRGATRVPNAPEEIMGIFSLRGRIVTLIDIARILGLEYRWKETLDSRIVVVRVEQDTFGFRADRVLRVARVKEDQIRSQPVVSGSERNAVMAGMLTLDGRTVSLLSAERLAG